MLQLSKNKAITTGVDIWQFFLGLDSTLKMAFCCMDRDQSRDFKFFKWIAWMMVYGFHQEVLIFVACDADSMCTSHKQKLSQDVCYVKATGKCWSQGVWWTLLRCRHASATWIPLDLLVIFAKLLKSHVCITVKQQRTSSWRIPAKQLLVMVSNQKPLKSRNVAGV